MADQPDPAYVDGLIALARKDAAKRRESAAYGGEWGDQGAGLIESNIEFYLAGREGRIPEEWKGYEKKLDPEFPEYLRLKEKFE